MHFFSLLLQILKLKITFKDRILFTLSLKTTMFIPIPFQLPFLLACDKSS